jgi:hypothetical protein
LGLLLGFVNLLQVQPLLLKFFGDLAGDEWTIATGRVIDDDYMKLINRFSTSRNAS